MPSKNKPKSTTSALKLTYPKISNPKVSFPQSFLEQKIQSKYGHGEYNTTQIVLSKYFPKYHQRLRIREQPETALRPSVLAKLKSIKVVNHFEFTYGWAQHGFADDLVASLLKNKRKSIKSCPEVRYQNEDDERELKFLRKAHKFCLFFPRIEVLDISSFCLDLHYSCRKQEKTLEWCQNVALKRGQYFGGLLRHVKHLKVTLFWNLLSSTFQAMRSSKKFLTSLESFHLKIPHERNLYDAKVPYERNSFDPKAFFRFLIKSQDILKYVTHISFTWVLRDLSFEFEANMITSFVNYCDKLSSFKLNLPINHYKPDDIRPNPQLKLVLTSLKYLQNVVKLNLTIKDIWDFVVAFVFPPFVETLSLSFPYNAGYSWGISRKLKDDNCWKFLYDDWSKNNSKIWHNFFRKIKKLSLLNSLKLCMPACSYVKDIMDNFIFPLLQAIPKLENLEYNLSYGDVPVSESFDISTFFYNIASLQALKSVKIFQPADWELKFKSRKDLEIIWIPPKIPSFPNMTAITIDICYINAQFDFKDLLNTFSASLKELTLRTIYVYSMKSFFDVLKVFKEAEQHTELKIELGIDLFLQDFTEISKYIECPLIPSKNAKIFLNIYISCTRLWEFSEQEIGRMQFIFGKLTFSIVLILKKNSKVKKFSDIIKNNYKIVVDGDKSDDEKEIDLENDDDEDEDSEVNESSENTDESYQSDIDNESESEEKYLNENYGQTDASSEKYDEDDFEI